ncbi:hypothetical protein V8C42DRAFT_337290 [Trichoderma barbatum]
MALEKWMVTYLVTQPSLPGKNLKYTVEAPSGDRVLLGNVHGWVKPGMLGALICSSGAGNTTLLDALAQRKIDGTINGNCLVDGRLLPVSFQRMAGYCEQLDVYQPFSTSVKLLNVLPYYASPERLPKRKSLNMCKPLLTYWNSMIGRYSHWHCWKWSYCRAEEAYYNWC